MVMKILPPCRIIAKIFSLEPGGGGGGEEEERKKFSERSALYLKF